MNSCSKSIKPNNYYIWLWTKIYVIKSMNDILTIVKMLLSRIIWRNEADTGMKNEPVGNAALVGTDDVIDSYWRDKTSSCVSNDRWYQLFRRSVIGTQRTLTKKNATGSNAIPWRRCYWFWISWPVSTQRLASRAPLRKGLIYSPIHHYSHSLIVGLLWVDIQLGRSSAH